MGLKRFSLMVVFAAVLALGIVSGAPAGNFDESRMGCPGEDPGVCPTGTTGTPYTLPIYLQGDEDEGCAVYTVGSGSLPPGLSLNSDGKRIEGTPTQAGTFDFYLTVTYNRETTCPFKNPSDDRFRIIINPGLAKLTIGPESARPGTTGAPYSLQMIATVEGQKTWSINSGTLPPGLTINAATGLISGTPTASGSYTFEVLARMATDTRSDTKVLGIVIRDPLGIFADEPFAPTRVAVGEVSAPFEAMLTATGGDGTYTWSLAAGALPPGLLFTGGGLAGVPRMAGVYGFTVRVTDAEGRVADYAARVVVVRKLVISTRLIKPGRVDKLFQRKLATLGGIKPTQWRKIRGPLPRGVFLDRSAGVLYGYPTRRGVFRVTFAATDTLGVTARKMLRIVVLGPPIKKKK